MFAMKTFLVVRLKIGEKQLSTAVQNLERAVFRIGKPG
jgi:hypothetical protein